MQHSSMLLLQSIDALKHYSKLGCGMQSFLVAVVIPEKKEIQSYAKQNGINGDYSDLLQNEQVRNARAVTDYIWLTVPFFIDRSCCAECARPKWGSSTAFATTCHTPGCICVKCHIVQIFAVILSKTARMLPTRA